MLGPHGGRGGQKRPKNGPHGLCMTPYIGISDHTFICVKEVRKGKRNFCPDFLADSFLLV